MTAGKLQDFLQQLGLQSSFMPMPWLKKGPDPIAGSGKC